MRSRAPSITVCVAFLILPGIAFGISPCSGPGDCVDELYCNGEERCDPDATCRPGATPCPGGRCREYSQTCITLANGLWLNFATSTAVPGLGRVENEDIVAYDVDSNLWQLVFDGSDVGLSAFIIDGLAVTPSGDLLLSFTNPGALPGMTGGPEGSVTLDDSDIVRFTPLTLGAATTGTFDFYFDGSDVGLTTDGEDIDAITLTSDGDLVVSTLSSYAVAGVAGNEKDLLRFDATSLGGITAGTFGILVRGFNLGLDGSASENVDAAGLNGSDSIMVSTGGDFTVPGAVGTNGDVIEFGISQWGNPTIGAFQSLWDFSALGIDATKNINALEWVEDLSPVDVFPDVGFTMTPMEGPDPLAVECTASQMGGGELPEGIYTWVFDDEEVSGTAESVGTITHEFTTSGAHVVKLFITLAGLSGPLACANTETGLLEGRTFVWPKISGRVIDENGSGVGGVTVMTLVESAATVSRPDGHYELSVPYGWSGFVIAHLNQYTLNPSHRNYEPIHGPISGQDFLAVAQSGAVLSGTLRDFQGLPVEGVVLHLNGVEGSNGVNYQVASDGNGHYGQSLPNGWSGTITTDFNHRLDNPSGVLTADDAAPVQLDYKVYRNYYVAPGGNDIAGGLMELPFRTIQRATTEARPGDTIFVRQGLYDLQADPAYHLSVIYFRHSGREGEPITLQAYPGELVTLTTAGSKGVFDFSDTWGHNTSGYGHYVFRGLRITGGRYGWLIRPPIPAWTVGDPLSALEVSQIHNVVIEDCEVVGNGVVEAAIYVRYGGIRHLTVRRCNFHHTIGTEGTVDIGEWRDQDPAHVVPRSASHDLLFEDCDFHHTVHQQANGIVTQPCVYNVTLRRCRAWNNGKYGFALKGSGNFRLDRCAGWGNDSSQMYCRGFGGDDSTPRPFVLNDFTLTNCVFVAPADQRGGAALNWRENADIRAYHCTVLGLRNETYGQAGGYSFLLGGHHNVPATAVLRNCIVGGYKNSPAVRFAASGSSPFMINTRYEGYRNLFYAEPTTKFKYQSRNMTSLSAWQAYWAVGEPNGNDGLNGPRATAADATSLYAVPGFVAFNAASAPLRKQWAADLLDPANYCDVRLLPNSPAAGLGENLSGMQIPELQFDYLGVQRPASGAWSAGAFQSPANP